MLSVTNGVDPDEIGLYGVLLVTASLRRKLKCMVAKVTILCHNLATFVGLCSICKVIPRYY